MSFLVPFVKLSVEFLILRNSKPVLPVSNSTYITVIHRNDKNLVRTDIVVGIGDREILEEQLNVPFL